MEPDANAVVDVIIPTIGRDSLLKAIDSVLSQTIKTRAIVVLDVASEAESVRALLGGRSYTLLLTKGQERAAVARNLGLDHASAPWVAFLDDDDWWGPTRLEKMLEAVDSVTPTAEYLIGAPFNFVLPDGSSRVVPTVAPHYRDGHGGVASYLIRRSALKFGENAMQTSTLLMSSNLAKTTRWRTELRKHQDWDFIVRLLQAPHIQFVWSDNNECYVQKDSPGSISKQMNWRASLEWLKFIDNGKLDRRSRNDFLWVHVLRAALAERSLIGFAEFLKNYPLWPHAAAAAVGFSGLVQLVRRRP